MARGTVFDYYARCWAAGRLIHRGFCLDLGLDEDFFEDKLDDPIGIQRLLHYPPRSEQDRKRLGAGAHCDYGNITLLATDGVEGLQVKPRGRDWIDAPTLDGALICNIGDCLMRWTGDLYVSPTPHRVVSRPSNRYSVAFFLDPNPDALRSGTLPGMAAKYPPMTGGDYLKMRLISNLRPPGSEAPERARPSAKASPERRTARANNPCSASGGARLPATFRGRAQHGPQRRSGPMGLGANIEHVQRQRRLRGDRARPSNP